MSWTFKQIGTKSECVKEIGDEISHGNPYKMDASEYQVKSMALHTALELARGISDDASLVIDICGSMSKSYREDNSERVGQSLTVNVTTSFKEPPCPTTPAPPPSRPC